MKAGILSLTLIVAVAVPTAGLVFLSWQWLASRERERVEQRRDAQVEAVHARRDSVAAALDQAIHREELLPWTASFHLMESVDGQATSATEQPGRWPTILKGRFILDRDGRVVAPTVLPVPELAEALRPVQQAAQLLARDVETSLGQLLRDLVSQGSGPTRQSLPARSEPHRCTELDALLHSLTPDDRPVLACDSATDLVTVRVQAPRIVVEPAASALCLAITRVVDIPGYGEILVGALLDGDRLLELPITIPDGEIALERAPVAPPAQGERLAGKLGVDARLPGHVITLREQVPTSIETSGREWRALFMGFCALLGICLLVSIWAMQRFIVATIQLDRDREQFVASVTHELRTPLAAIRMFAELLGRSDAVHASEPNQRYVEHIVGEVGRLDSLVENVLMLAALEHGSQPLNPVRADLGEAMLSLLAIRRPYLERRGVELEVSIEDGLPSLEFDRLAVGRILDNLLENAVKYGVTEDARSVEVRLTRDGTHITLEVADRGRGLGDSAGAGLFQRFTRNAVHRRSSTGGIGLGLSIVSELARLHGGDVVAEDREGGGAAFRVRLPIG